MKKKTLLFRLDNGIEFLGYQLKAWQKNQTKVTYTNLQNSQNQEKDQKTLFLGCRQAILNNKDFRNKSRQKESEKTLSFEKAFCRKNVS